jgi:peptidoglycan/LPS O-acetylase OafA/YrhL
VQLNPAKIARPVHADGRRYVPAIDGLRCLAAWAVISAHIGSVNASHHLVAYYGAAAYPALIVFFTISGFLVYRPFARAVLAPRPKSESDQDRSTNFWVYILRRVLRIFPLYWAVLGVALIAHTWFRVEGMGPVQLNGLTDWVQAIFLLPIPHPMRLLSGPLGIAMWTLAIELPFYVLVPLYSVGLKKLQQRFAPDADPFRTLVTGTLTLIGFIFGLGLVFGGELAFPVMSLPVGMLFAVLETKQSLDRRRYKLIKVLSDNWWLCIAGYVALVFFGANLALNAYADHPGQSIDPYAKIRNYYFPLQMAMALLIFIPVAFGRRKSFWVRTMASTPLQMLAPLTYGIYLWHVPLIHYTQQWFGPGLMGFPVPGTHGYGFPTIFIAIVLAATTFLVVELPAAKLRTAVDRWSRGEHVAPADPDLAVGDDDAGMTGEGIEADAAVAAGDEPAPHVVAQAEAGLATVRVDEDVSGSGAELGAPGDGPRGPTGDEVLAGAPTRSSASDSDQGNPAGARSPRRGPRPAGAKRPGSGRSQAAGTGPGGQLATPWCEPIDGFRALSACIAVTGHTFLAASLYPFPGLLHAMGIIVALFFAISAYVLYQPFLEADVRRLPRPQAGSFYIRRLLRIYPLFAIALTAYLVFLPEVRPDNLWATARLYLFLQIFGSELAGDQIRGMGSAWYLCNEVIFYLAMP